MITASDYHRIVLRPSLDAFYACDGDLRLAMQAAVALTHSVDYAFRHRDPDPAASRRAADAYRDDLVGRCYAFGVVEGFATASKRGTVDWGALRGVSPSRHDEPAVSSFGTVTFGHLAFDDAAGGIHVDWRDDGWVSLAHSLRTSCSILETELPELLVPPPGPQRPANAP